MTSYFVYYVYSQILLALFIILFKNPIKRLKLTYLLIKKILL